VHDDEDDEEDYHHDGGNDDDDDDDGSSNNNGVRKAKEQHEKHARLSPGVWIPHPRELRRRANRTSFATKR